MFLDTAMFRLLAHAIKVKLVLISAVGVEDQVIQFTYLRQSRVKRPEGVQMIGLRFTTSRTVTT